jgi:hypothetical protein
MTQDQPTDHEAPDEAPLVAFAAIAPGSPFDACNPSSPQLTGDTTPQTPTQQHSRGRSCAALTALWLCAALPGAALAQEAPGYEQYRQSVLGDRAAHRAEPPPPTTRIEARTLPGPHATYLIRLGQDPGQAIRAARTIGEAPTLRTTRITRLELSSLERYERLNGRLDRPDELREVLSDQPIDDSQRSGSIR